MKFKKGIDVNMIVIKFSVYNQRLRKITSGIIPSNAYGKLKFEFDFRTDDWKTIEVKTVNFYCKGENHSVDLDENNQCYVPKEVIRIPSFKISVLGGDITTNYVTNYIENISTNSNGVPPSFGDAVASSKIFVPSINEDKILSWTISSGDDLKIPDPVDLNPFDEWSTDGDIVSEYEWEEE